MQPRLWETLQEWPNPVNGFHLTADLPEPRGPTQNRVSEVRTTNLNSQHATLTLVELAAKLASRHTRHRFSQNP
ncbi:MAG: hypothetical protein AB7P76_02810 [Candidatus Melainabacteria bacterium]